MNYGVLSDFKCASLPGGTIGDRSGTVASSGTSLHSRRSNKTSPGRSSCGSRSRLGSRTRREAPFSPPLLCNDKGCVNLEHTNTRGIQQAMLLTGLSTITISTIIL